MILTGRKIYDRMVTSRPDERLYVTPLLPGQLDLDAASIDLHLGHDFLSLDRPRVPYIDPARVYVTGEVAVEDEAHDVPVTTHHYVPWGQGFTLHPGAFALAATLEYMSLPNDLAAHVLGRSTWARVGLVIAMATLVHPGYAGCLTLELQNLGSAPITLSPGLRVAQLVMEDCSTVPLRPPHQITCAIQPERKPLVSCTDRRLLAVELWGRA